MKKTRSLIIGIVAIVLCIGLFVGLYLKFAPKPDAGTKAYEVEVTYDDQSKKYSGKTDAAYLIELMDELKQSEDFTYESMSSDFGAYITSVNGVSADDASKTYWAIYVNGEYGQYGADQQPVNDGDAFRFSLESYE